jgi:hypothetical protein
MNSSNDNGFSFVVEACCPSVSEVNWSHFHMTDAYLYIHLWLLYNIQAAYFEAEYIFLSFNLIECFPASNHYKVLIYSKKPTLYGFCTKPTKSALKSLENSILGFGLFSELFRTFIPGCLCISSQNAFWRVRIVFLRFGIYGNT